VAKRIAEHKRGIGCKWTNTYPMLKLEKTILNASPYDEDRYVKEYMDIYGMDNVRGGTYSAMELTADQVQTIQREKNGAQDECLNCGKAGHFANTCRVVNRAKKQTKKIVCYRCGRSSHIDPNCYARTDVDDNKLSDSEMIAMTIVISIIFTENYGSISIGCPYCVTDPRVG
jgi:hypothetical protein